MSLSAGPIAGGATSSMQGASAIGRRFPYLIQQGVQLEVPTVRVRITAAISGTGNPKIRGKVSGTVQFDPQTLTLDTRDEYVASLEAKTAFSANLTAFYNPYNIEWEVTRDGTTWEGAGTSSNPLYVCLADPKHGGPLDALKPFRTVVHLACSPTPGATDADSAVANTWALFSGKTVQTWDEKPLHYYAYQYTVGATPLTVENLLTLDKKFPAFYPQGVRSGNCTAFERLLGDAWALNGAESEEIEVKPTEASGFTLLFVNDWGSLGSLFWFQSLVINATDMIPWPNSGTEPYGYYDSGSGSPRYFENKTTKKGQNSGDNAPSQKVFELHRFRRYQAASPDFPYMYYDPSYGLQYSGSSPDAAKLDFQTQALAGYGVIVAESPRRVAFTAESSVIVVKFGPPT